MPLSPGRRLAKAATRWALLLLALLVALPALAGEVTVDMLDIGQGDSILIRGGGKAVLIDAGIPGSKVVEQLQALGVTRLDMVVATHPHADHIGDMEKVVRAFPIALYMDNGLPHTTVTYTDLMKAIEELGIPYRAAHQGQVIKLGEEATFTVLWPGDTPLTDTRSDLNSNSVVMLLEHGTNKFLFTGDSEEPTEQALLAAGLPKVDVLKVAHHGSDHSSTQPFLDAVHPSVAIISCGTGNSYGHPGPETIARLTSIGAHIYRTDLLGHIRVTSDGKKITVADGFLPEFRGLAARQAPQTGSSHASHAAASADPVSGVLEMTAPIEPGHSAEEMGVDLHGIQPANPAFDDMGPDSGKHGHRKHKPKPAGQPAATP